MATDFLSRTEWITHDASADLGEMERMLRVAVNLASRGVPIRVTLQIHAADVRGGSPAGRRRRGQVAQAGTVSLYGSGAQDTRGLHGRGIDPRYILTTIVDHDGDVRAAMEQLAGERPDTAARGVEWVEMHVFEATK